MELPLKITCNNEDETRTIARQLALELEPGDVIALNGNLGSGKTFFTNAVCEALDVDFTSSPTFSIVNEYNGKYIIYHFDFYRIENQAELYDIGYEEYLNDESAIVFIEWAELLPELLPRRRYQIEVKTIVDDKREIAIDKYE